MPKLPVYTPKTLIKKLLKLGFVKDHQSGSHLVMYHPITGRRAVIPHHLKDLKKGTLHSLINEAGISRDELLNIK